MDRLTSVTGAGLESHSRVIPWDSHLALVDAYINICSNVCSGNKESIVYQRGEQESNLVCRSNDNDDGEWMCGNANHPGYVVVKAVARKLLRQIRRGFEL